MIVNEDFTLKRQIELNRLVQGTNRYYQLCKAERKFIIQNHDKMSKHEIARFLCRDHSSISRACKRLGLEDGTQNKQIIVPEIQIVEFLQSHPMMSNLNVSHAIHVGLSRIRTIRKKHNIPGARKSQKMFVIEKACKWLSKNTNLCDKKVQDFRKAMEE